jgi:group I intron endonuclease
LKYGYSNFKLEILEYCDQELLICREQYYLDLLKPKYNICKTAGSTLGKLHSESTKEKISMAKTGIKHDISFSKNLSKARRGRKLKKSGFIVNTISKVTTVETRLKLSERSRGVSVKVFDKNNNLINQFPNIKTAAKHIGVDSSTIGKIFRTGISYDNYIYKFKVKDLRV